MHGPRNLYNELHRLREDQHVANSHEPHTEEDDSDAENIENVIYSDDEAFYDDDNGGQDRESRFKRDREISQLMSTSMTEDQLRRKYKQLEDESLRRFWERNQEIFLKYSTIDDATESDEIDLVTGEIVTDNGHLERLYGNGSSESGLKGNIWRTDYNRYLRDLESMYDARKNMGKTKKKNTRMIKKLDLFSGRLGRSEKDTNVMKFSPTKGKVPSGLDREESPTKKRRLGIEIYADESGVEDDDNVAYGESDEESYVESGTETPEIEGPLYDEPEDDDEDDDTGELYYESLIVNDRNKPLRSSKIDKTNLLPPEYDNAEPEHSWGELSETQSIRETTPSLPPPPPSSSSETEDFPTSSSEEPQPASRNKLSFDEEYHVIEDPILYLFPTSQEQEHSKSIKIYRCAFKNTCKYCTGNKKLYESHLLSLHSFQLYKLGYPISNPYQPSCPSSSSSSSEDKIDVDLIGLLTDFPQKLRLDLPRTSYSCNTPLASSSTHQKCQKFYMTSEELEEHKMRLDDCSAKSLVLLCPILGCGYMTDCGYADWRIHMIELGHAVPVPTIPGDTIGAAGTVKQEKRTRSALEISRKVNVGVPKFKETDGRKVELKFIEAGSDPSIDELFN
ncbi:hypothetical protein Cantr_04664 [Candida viswanathii]|uniref:Uncharacterized protein n=1 Tax=Candida viswanathii TaxID=5486 RepID=A0A367XQD0_9ASCO|nr:hypothetical protein Cantr_04664 [Candida viswanathii]